MTSLTAASVGTAAGPAPAFPVRSDERPMSPPVPVRQTPRRLQWPTYAPLQEVPVFARLGPWCHDNRKKVLAAWVAILVLGFVAQGAIGSAFRDEFNLPDVESKTGFDILDEEFGGQGTGIVGTIVFRAEQGVDDPEVREGMTRVFDEVAQEDDVLRVESPYAEEGGRQISSEGEEAGRIAYANVEMPDDIDFGRAEEIRNTILDDVPDIDGV